MRSRNYVFTINNYTKKILKEFEKKAQSLEKHQYICYGLETGEKKTKHIQAYIQLIEPLSYKQVQKYFNIQKKGKLDLFHLEPAKGTLEQNKKYTSKDGDWVEYGEPKKQGSRTDLSELKNSIRENPKDIFNLVDNDVQNNQQLRFIQNLQGYYFKKRDIDNPPKVYWIFGKSGIGKTKIAYDSFEDICSVSNYDWIGTDYNQQECLLFDDFRKSEMKFNYLLKICDRYPLTLFYKGGQIPLNSPYIVFTSPKSIKDTFGDHDEDLYQLERRIIQIDLNNFKVNDLKEVDKNLLVEKKPYEQRTLDDEF